MILNEESGFKICFVVLIFLHFFHFNGCTQDQTTRHANTLQDDADDIQRQLDNEARDRFKYDQPQNLWVFHMTPGVPMQSYLDLNERRNGHQNHKYPSQRLKNQAPYEEHNAHPSEDTSSYWNYQEQLRWHEWFKHCNGSCQSPISLPTDGLVMGRYTRPLIFYNYKVKPESLSLLNDGNRVTMQGTWNHSQWPMVYGGAAHSRRYLFHSLTVHWPSEHTVGNLYYPMETQILHVSAEYASLEDAIKASKNDQQAMLGIVNIYQYEKTTHPGLSNILESLVKMNSSIFGFGNSAMTSVPLEVLTPPFRKYACYQGSLPFPPCTESVLWFVRSKTLGVTRDDVAIAKKIFNGPNYFPNKLMVRHVQPLNDRTIMLFH